MTAVKTMDFDLPLPLRIVYGISAWRRFPLPLLLYVVAVPIESVLLSRECDQSISKTRLLDHDFLLFWNFSTTIMV